MFGGLREGWTLELPLGPYKENIIFAFNSISADIDHRCEGYLFRRTEIKNSKSEIIVMITPHLNFNKTELSPKTVPE